MSINFGFSNLKEALDIIFSLTSCHKIHCVCHQAGIFHNRSNLTYGQEEVD